ncbi:MAG TPA: serine/threonine-protein kinase [Vicinamibacterales bacterium]|nr:serine/threonine-protein kinase [Vicinamibacterales bacterium]
MKTGVFNRIGPYEIEREIGRGGMAVVFLARDTRSNLDVALKQVPVGLDRETREVFEAEQWGARLQEQFSAVSPLVPKVYERRTIGDHFYVAMEYVDGENLSDTIGRGPVPVARAVSIAMELARFLDAAHRFEVTLGDRNLRALLHGDLKPKNVRITPGDRVKVLDFGIAKALSMTRRVTRNDFGSIAYLSPERLESGEIDEASDLWAIGVLLYEMLSGTPPFRGIDTRRIEDRIKSKCPPAPLEGDCPPALQAVVAKVLAPDLSARYPTAAAIIEDLSRFTAGEGTAAERDGFSLAVTVTDEAPTRPTRPPADAPEPVTTPIVDEGSTRRTKLGPDQAAAARASRRSPWFRRVAGVGLILAMTTTACHESYIRAQANRVAGTVPIQDFDGLTAAWDHRDALFRKSWLGGAGVGELERALVQHTAILAERVIENYRLPRPTVREAQWSVARANLARAVAAKPRDSRLQAALRYCDGHLHRINGEARLRRGEAAAAQHAFTEAVTAFREAAEARSDWADPFLGLARTFIYGLEDLERGADAMKRAERLGYPLGDRETVQLADGYRARGESLARTATTLRGMTQEEEYLTRATEAYREAINLYSKVVDFANTAGNIRRTDRLLKQVELRLAFIKGERLAGFPWD